MQVIFETPFGHVLLGSGLSFLHTSPKYGSLTGTLMGIQSGSVEPQGQLF